MFTVLLCKIYIALHTQAGQTAKEKMRITQVRDDGKVNTMRTLKIEQLVEQMKKETKAQLVSNMRGGRNLNSVPKQLSLYYG
jgi:hypothetical protein